MSENRTFDSGQADCIRPTSANVTARGDGGENAGPGPDLGFASDFARSFALFERAPIAILIVNQSGDITQANAAAEQLFGYFPIELVGQRVEILLPEQARSRHRQLRADYMLDPSPRPMAAGRRLAGIRKDGSNISVDIALNPIVSAEGATSVILWITDNSARERADTAELFVSELAHRARNMFSIISAISRQIARSSSSLSEFQPAFERRLNSLVASYQVFERASWHSASLHDLVNSQVEFVMREGHGQIDIQGPDIGLPPNPAEYLGLAIHELSTNALKHGALSAPEGRVDIRWSVNEEDESFQFSWSERDGPAFSPPSRSGFGSVILKSIVPAAFGGAAELQATEIGMTWRLHAPSSILLSPRDMRGGPGEKKQRR